MASNEDILMQFNAEDNITSVVEAMESSVSSALQSITSAIDELDLGLSNLASSADSMSSSFSDLESSFDSAESSASNFQSTLDMLSADNVADLSTDVDNVTTSLSEATDEASNLASEISGLDGTTIDVNIDAQGLGGGSDWDADAEFGGEMTGQDTSALRTSMYDDLVGMSDTIRGVGEQAVESASAAEQGWLRFGNAVRNSGGNWDAQSDSIKAWVKDYSNSMGRGVADTRTAMTTYLNMGMNLQETQKALKVTSSYAAQFGISQAEASKMMQMSFMGAGRSVKKLGLDIKDFKDEAGNVDKEKLMNAIMEKTSGAAEKYADTYEARVQRMNNAINSLRTDFGKEIINTIEPLIPIAQQALQAFGSLPQPIKSAIMGFAGLAGGAAIVAGPLIKMRAYLRMGGVEIGSLRKGLETLRLGYTKLAGGEGIGKAIRAMKDFNKAKGAGDAAKNVLGNTGAGKGMGTVEKEAGQVIKSGTGIGNQSGAANTAGTKMQATSTGLRGIGQGAMAMLVPLLEIALVVAIIIPVITALAAEALIFLKGLQLLIDALDFDKIDLTGAIEGIKQIGRALLEMGIAMAEMTFANVMTGLAVLTSGLTGFINPVQIAGQMLIQAANELKAFSNVQIDPSVPANLKKISDALRLVSAAMFSLTSVVTSMAMGNIMTLGGLLGNVSSAITTAKNEITHAAQEIATIKDLPDIDQGAATKLEKISTSIKSIATAMDALRSLRDGYNWDNMITNFVNGIFGGADIQQALLSVRSDLYRAANALSVFNAMPTVPEGVGTKLKSVADALKSVSDSISVLRQLRDDFNWDNGIGSLFQGTDIPGVINQIRGDLFRVATSLSTLNSMAEIPEGTAAKINKVSSTTKTVMTAIDNLKQLNESIGNGGEGGGNLNNVIKNIDIANTVIRQVASRLVSLGTIATVPDGLGGKLNKIGSTTNQLKGTVSAVNGVPQMQEGASEKVKQAVNAVRKIASQLNQLNGTNVNAGIGQVLSSVRNAISQLRSTLAQSSGGFRSSGVSIGNGIKAGIGQSLNGLSGVVRGRVASAMGGGASAAWTGGARMGSNATRGFQSAFKLADIARAEMTYSTQAIQNGTGPFVQAVHDMAQKAVDEAKATAGVQSPGHIAHMWGDEMGYSAGQIASRGVNLINSIRNVTQRAVNAGQANLNMGSAYTTDMTRARLNALNSMNQTSNMGKPQRPISITIGEGAVQLDARNLTTQESRQIMINAIEELEIVKGIDVKGA